MAHLTPSAEAFIDKRLREREPKNGISQSKRRLLEGEEYQLIGQIGKGGMAEAYLAKDRRTDQKVVLKAMRDDHRTIPHLRKIFCMEPKILRHLAGSRHIVEALTDARMDSASFTMEYVQGVQLFDLVCEMKGLEPKMAVSIFIDLCEAVSACFRRDVLHQDLNSKNFMVNIRGYVYLLDFGLSNCSQFPSLPSGPFGTQEYMAPEVFVTQKRTRESEIYSTGAIFYEMVTNRLPVEMTDITSRSSLSLDEKWEAVGTRTANDYPDFTISGVQNLPAHVRKLLIAMLEKKPENRPTIEDAFRSLKLLN